MQLALVGFLLSFLICFVLCLFILPLLRRLKMGQPILKYVSEHREKSGTATMGGVTFVLAILITSLALCGVSSRNVNMILGITFAFAVVGFLDDYIKIRRKDNEGLKPYQKIVFQFSIASIVAVYAYRNGFSALRIPFFKDKFWDISFGIIPLVVFVFLATVNCVNLTDGLDGLASGTSSAYLLGMALLCLKTEEQFTQISMISVGALLAFLIFNTNKASVFMGDTGSLALGGLIASISVFSSHTLFIPIMGIMFVVSGISVIAQVIYYKRTKKRLFLMAPLHHHFQHKGYGESKIGYGYFIITLIVSLFCVLYA